MWHSIDEPFTSQQLKLNGVVNIFDAATKMTKELYA
jgi:hypothetical protein